MLGCTSRAPSHNSPRRHRQQQRHAVRRASGRRFPPRPGCAGGRIEFDHPVLACRGRRLRYLCKDADPMDRLKGWLPCPQVSGSTACHRCRDSSDISPIHSRARVDRRRQVAGPQRSRSPADRAGESAAPPSASRGSTRVSHCAFVAAGAIPGPAAIQSPAVVRANPLALAAISAVVTAPVERSMRASFVPVREKTAEGSRIITLTEPTGNR